MSAVVVGSRVVATEEACSQSFVAFEDTCCSRLALTCEDRTAVVGDTGNSV